MLPFFDYIFFRGYHFLKSRKYSNPVVGGILAVSMVQISITVGCLMVSCYYLATGVGVGDYGIIKTMFGISSITIILIFNSFRYLIIKKTDNFKAFDNAWGNESINAKIRNGCVAFADIGEGYNYNLAISYKYEVDLMGTTIHLDEHISSVEKYKRMEQLDRRGKEIEHQKVMTEIYFGLFFLGLLVLLLLYRKGLVLQRQK